MISCLQNHSKSETSPHAHVPEHGASEASSKEQSQGCPDIEGKTCVQATQEREAQLANELAVLSAELVRVRHVAGRATAREIANGSKDEGIVPMKMHLEEVCCLPFISVWCQQ